MENTLDKYFPDSNLPCKRDLNDSYVNDANVRACDDNFKSFCLFDTCCCHFQSLIKNNKTLLGASIFSSLWISSGECTWKLEVTGCREVQPGAGEGDLNLKRK